MKNKSCRSPIHLTVFSIIIVVLVVLVTGLSVFAGVINSVALSYEEGYTKLENGRTEASQQFSDAEIQIYDGEQELLVGRKTLNQAEVGLSSAEKDLAAGEAELTKGQILLTEAEAELDIGLQTLQAVPIVLNKGLAELQEGEKALNEGKVSLKKGEATYCFEKTKAEEQLADGLVELKMGEDNLSVGRAAVATGQSTIQIIQGVISGASSMKAALSDPSSYFAAYSSFFPGISTWTDYLTMADAYIAAGNGNTGTIVEQVRQSLIVQEMGNQQETIHARVDQQINEMINAAFGSNDTIINPFTNTGEIDKSTYRALVESNVTDSVTTVVHAEVEVGVNANLLALGNGVQGGAATVFDMILSQTADLPTLINGLLVLDPSLAGSLASIQGVLSLPQSTVNEKSAKSQNLSAAMNDFRFIGLLQGVQFAIQQSVDEGIADIAKGEQTLKIGWEEYNRLKSMADQLLAKGWAELEAGRTEIQVNEIALAEGLAAYQEGMQDYLEGKATYHEGKALYLERKAEYDSGLVSYREGKAAYSQGQADYEAGLADYENGHQTWLNGREEYKIARAAVEKQLAEGEHALASAESLLVMVGANIQTGMEHGNIPFAHVTHSFDLLPWLSIIIVAFLLTFWSLRLSISTLKRNIGYAEEMRNDGCSNISITIRLMKIFYFIAIISSCVGIVVGVPLVNTLLIAVSGETLNKLSVATPYSTLIVLTIAVVIATIIGSLLSSKRLNDLITRATAI